MKKRVEMFERKDVNERCAGRWRNGGVVRYGRVLTRNRFGGISSDTLTCAGQLYGYEMNVQYSCREEMKGM